MLRRARRRGIGTKAVGGRSTRVEEWLSRYTFGGAAPLTRCIARVDFVRPVDVGSLLALKSAVVHAEGDTICVDVSAAVWKPDKLETNLTNTFSFVFTVPNASRPLKKVLPATRTEAAQQLDAVARLRAGD